MVRVRASDPEHRVLAELALLLCYAHNPHLTGITVDLPEVERRALIATLEAAMAKQLQTFEARHLLAAATQVPV